MSNILDIYKKHKEGINYLIFGGITTVLTLTVYFLLTISLLNPNDKFQLQIANILSWTVGFIFAYFVNRKYVFESKNEKVFDEFTKFFFSRISTLILDMAIMFIFVTTLKLNDKFIKFVSQVCVILGNYILSKLIVFKKNEHQ